MRILYLHPKSWTGEYVMLLQLRLMGHEVCALEEKRALERGARQITDHHREPGDGIATLWYDPRRGWERLLTWLPDRIFRRAFDGRNLVHRMWVIYAALRYFEPDVVICSDGFTYAIPAAFLKRLGLLRRRLITGFIGGDILDCSEAGVGRRRTWLTDRLIKISISAPEVLRPVSPLLEQILLRDGAAKERLHVCPSHLVISREDLQSVYVRRNAIRIALRERYDIPQKAPLIITLGANHKGKGIQILAKNWSRIRAAVPNVHWLLAGPPTEWLDRAVWPQLRAQGADVAIHVTGMLAQRDVFEHLAAADLHVNPSLCESLNMVTVEAAAVGTPTITSDGAGIADWVARFGAGVVVPNGDAGQLADAIIKALQSRDGLACWTDRARAMAEEFALERIAAQLIQLMNPQAL